MIPAIAPDAPMSGMTLCELNPTCAAVAMRPANR